MRGPGRFSQGEGRRVFLAVSAVQGVGSLGEGFLVFVGVQVVRVLPEDIDGHVAAVVGDPLVIGEQVVEHEAVLQRAFLPAHPVDMAGLQLVAQVIDDLFQRVYSQRRVPVVVDEGADRDARDLAHGVFQNAQFPLGRGGEGDLLVQDLLRRRRYLLTSRVWASSSS